MRKILFKAKDTRSGDWVQGYLVNTIDEYRQQISMITEIGARYYNYHEPIYTHRVASETVCQYTGLEDSCGNKIFESDLIKLTPSSDTIFVITWSHNDCCFEITNLDSDKSFPLNELLVKEATVLGNKFDIK